MTDRLSPTHTFLFTDIEGSTRLWEQQPKAMRAALAQHDALLRQAIESSGGHLFKTVGDAFCAAFASAEAALQAAITAQRALHQELPELRVRMALYTGEAEAVGADYFGPALNRAARLLAAGHGGQVLLSQATVDVLHASLPPGMHLHPLGAHRLRDLVAREAIFQLVAPHLPAEFPPLNTLDVAFRRGLQRATAIAAVVVAVTTGLALVAAGQARLARMQRGRAEQQRRLAEEREQTARRYLYASQMKLAQQFEEAGDVSRARRILEALRPEPGQEELRGFEWRHLWLRCQGDARATWDFQEGHVIIDLAYSPDGRLIAVADYPNLRLLEAATGRTLAVLRENSGIYCLAFSPNGRIIAAVGDDSIVRLWDTASRRLVAALAGHQRSQRIHSVAFSPNGRLLATACWDRTVRLWDVPRRRQAAVLSTQTSLGTPHDLAFTSDGWWLAIGNQNGSIDLWSVALRRRIATPRGHTEAIAALSISPNGRVLATASTDGTVKLWPFTGDPRQMVRQSPVTLPGHEDGTSAVVFSPDGTMVASAGWDYTVRLWDLLTRRERRALRGHRGPVRALAFAPDGKTIISGGNDATVNVWDVSTWGGGILVLRQGAPVTAIALAPSAATLATGGLDGTIRLWSLPKERLIAVLRGHTARILWLQISPDGRSMASGGDDHTVRLWDLPRKCEVASFAEPGRAAGDGAFSPDGKTLAIALSSSPGRPGMVQFWDVSTRRLMKTLSGYEEGVQSVEYSPDGARLAIISGFLDGQFLDPKTGHVREFGDLMFPPVLFSPDGRLLVAHGESDDATLELPVRLWDVATQRRLATLRGSSKKHGAMAFTPDGTTLAEAHGSTIDLWNLPTRQDVAHLQGHRGTVTGVVFAPDGRLLISGSEDGTIRLWHATTLGEADTLRVVATGGDRRVSLQWQPAPHAVGYRVYRGPAHAAGGALTALTSRTLAATTYTDESAALENGRTQSYAITALFQGERGRMTQGPRTLLQATPVAVPPGYLGCSINEGLTSGRVVRNDAVPTLGSGAQATITLRGSGRDLWDSVDGCYLLSRPVTGDFVMTVRALTRPTLTKDWAAGGEYAKAGLMLRESLDPSSRDAYLVITPHFGMFWQWRPVTHDDCGTRHPIEHAALRLPILLRLTRRGSTVTAAYSRDEGGSFQPAGEPLSFDPPLSPTVFAGLVITSHQAGKSSEAKFSDLQILQP